MFQRILVANRGEIALRDHPRLQGARHRGRRGLLAGRPRRALPRAGRPRPSASAGPQHRQLPQHPPHHRRRRDCRRPGHPPRLRLPQREPDFADSCRSSSIEFIGPPHDAIRKMGLKTEAKQIAAEAEVPCVPGSDGVVTNDAEAMRLARRDRLPRADQGRRRRRRQGHARLPRRGRLADALQAARSEAENAFKDASVYIEKFIDQPRHVEVQILGRQARATRPSAGTATAPSSAATRSSSRRSPGPDPPRPQVRRSSCKAAVRLAKAAGYVNAGTCRVPGRPGQQFLLHRGQRPHPGRAPRHRDGHRHRPGQAADPRSPPASPCLQQDEIELARPCHRVPDQRRGSRQRLPPLAGRITALRIPGGPGVRWDSHVQAGYAIPPYYDSLIGKLIVHGLTRDEAIATMRLCPRRAGHRGGEDDNPAPQADPPQSRLPRQSVTPPGSSVSSCLRDPARHPPNRGAPPIIWPPVRRVLRSGAY